MRAPPMFERPLSADTLRAAALEISTAEQSRTAPPDALLALARVVAECLIDQASHRAVAVSPTTVDARVIAVGPLANEVKLPSADALAVLRTGPRSEQERALVAALAARHLGALLDRRDGVSALRAALPSLDWLEFVGQYPVYSAARFALDGDTLARADEILRAAPVEAPTERAAAAVRALRGAATSPSNAPVAPSGAGRTVTLSAEVEGAERTLFSRLVTVAWSGVAGALRAVLRTVFSLRSPATLTWDGEQLRVAGHTEILGRTVRSFDHRFALANVTELQREARFPMLPVSLSVFALFVGSTLGARYIIEGIGGRYWVLVALGLGVLASGVLFDFVARALFPGVEGRTRLTVRTRDRRGLVISGLDIGELDAMLDAIDQRARSAAPALRPLLSGADALSDATVRDPDAGRAAR